jgi:serine/threonine-protein kinase
VEHAGSYGQFQLLRYLSQGQVTEVFLARDPSEHGPDGLLVVERLLPNASQQPRFVETFLDEAGIAGTLKHPNIVQIYDLGELDGQFFVAMEYVRGGSLYDLLDRRQDGKLDLGDTLFVVGEVCAGLQFAHSLAGPDGELRNLIHRELNPRHVLVSVDGVVKISDFGMASALEVVGIPPPGDPKEHRAYLAPEQIEGKPIDRRADIYACGALLYRLTTGQLPGSLADNTFVPPQQIAQDLPQSVVNLIIRAMSPEPKARHTTCGALRRDIIQAAKTLPKKGDRASLAILVQAEFPEVGGWGATDSQAPPPHHSGITQPPLGEEDNEPNTSRRLLGNTTAGTPPARAKPAQPPPPPSAAKPPPPPGASKPPPPPPQQHSFPRRDGRANTLPGLPQPGNFTPPPPPPKKSDLDRDDTQRGLPQPGNFTPPPPPKKSDLDRDDTQRGHPPPPHASYPPQTWSQGTPSGSVQFQASAPAQPAQMTPTMAQESPTLAEDGPSVMIAQMPSSEGAYMPQGVQPSFAPSYQTTSTPPPARETRQERPKRGLLVPILLGIIIILLLLSGVAVFLLGPWSPLWDSPYVAEWALLGGLMEEEGDPSDPEVLASEEDPNTTDPQAASDESKPPDETETPATPDTPTSGDQAPVVEVVGGGPVNQVTTDPPVAVTDNPPEIVSDPPREGSSSNGVREDRRHNEREGRPPRENNPPREEVLTPAVVEQPDPRSDTPRRSSERTGRLYVLTAPYARVYLDSRLLGTTPIINQEIPAGRHTLYLVNPSFPSHRTQITVRAGQITRVSHLFEQSQ